MVWQLVPDAPQPSVEVAGVMGAVVPCCGAELVTEWQSEHALAVQPVSISALPLARVSLWHSTQATVGAVRRAGDSGDVGVLAGQATGT